MAFQHTTLLLILTILTTTTTTALPPETLTNAADTLSNSGYVAMSLTLNLVQDVLLSHHTSATIFTPPDSSFADSGQPSLSLLSLHFSPLAFSQSSLRSLPYGTKIPTVDANTYLTVTTPSAVSLVSINDVRIVGSPIFDDGSLIIFAIEKFFDANFTVAEAPMAGGKLEHCTASFGGDVISSNFSFHDGANVLISRGYSVMAAFLNLQLLGFLGGQRYALTVFAPVDEVMVDYSGSFPEYNSLFLRHVLPCKVSWRDLVSVVDVDDEGDGSEFDTYLSGFKVRISRSDGTFKVNEVSIAFPDMYYTDWFVVHGIREVLSLPKAAEEIGDGEGDPFDEGEKRISGRMLVAADLDRSEF
ncbi:FAS1 domain-containing protein [Artemisia annua]|uniref:FAS1 domain-containing protein n=1 Tax=Artemisia annua TaxID=35608 RepID=A0A2U1KZ62_ARTAN|nr:FAS1 domain-containing protein [Artemisia annua]